MSHERHARLLSAIAELAPADPPLQALCRASVGLLGVSSAAIILMSDKETGRPLVTSDPEATAVEDLQFTLGEGPCLQAYATGAPVLEPDLTMQGSRWPMFVRGAVEMDVRAIFAIPLQVGVIRLGVLYLCQTQPGMLSSDELADAFSLAEIATWLVLEEQAVAEAGDVGIGLDLEWSDRAVVHQATGMLAAQLDVGLREALSRLRSTAFGDGRTIYEVSTDIVSRRRLGG